MKSIKKKIFHFLGNRLLPIVINLVLLTYKIQVKNANVLEDYAKNGNQFIAAFWHGKMLIPWYFLRKFNISALVSLSKDGEILSRILESWNYKMIRGSSHIGGKEALKLLEDSINNGFSVAITPDGPTGPIYKMKPGTIVLAKKTNKPIFLILVCAEESWFLKSWDKFQIPKPFSKIKLEISEPISVDANLNYDETDLLIKQLNERFLSEQRKIEENC